MTESQLPDLAILTSMISFFPSRTIALTLGPLAIHWYGLMYLLAFLIGMWLIPRLQKHRGLRLDAKQREILYISVFIGVLVGGRLGYALFYGLPYFIAHPLEIFAVWKGGMASHGGIIGVSLALLLFARKHKISVLALADTIAVPVAIGLALGRIGNFINQELYGTVTTLPWGMHFDGVEGLRHPTQIYAFCKDIFIAAMAYWHLIRTSWTKMSDAPGGAIAIFLMLYGVLRFVVEYFREQPDGFVSAAGILLSRGQLLTIPVLILGLIVWFGRPYFNRAQALSIH